MKLSKTFSFEEKTITRFLQYCRERQINPSRKIESMAEMWCKEIEGKKAKIVKCRKCGAKYSDVLEICPQCEIKKIEEREKEIKKAEKTQKQEKEIEIEKLQARKKMLIEFLKEKTDPELKAKYKYEIAEVKKQIKDLMK